MEADAFRTRDSGLGTGADFFPLAPSFFHNRVMSGRGEIRRAEYKALLTEAYDLDKPEAPPGELAYYRQHIRACGEPVLEAMCGSGRFLVPLLEAGIDVDGVDASPDMLVACGARCADRGLEARTYEQFLHELDVPAAVPADLRRWRVLRADRR